MSAAAIDLRTLAEELADVLEERGLVCRAATAPQRVLDVAHVADLLGRSRDWVYDNARDLGAFRMGTGPKARLGFDLQHIEAWKREQAIAKPTAAPARKARPRRGRAADPSTDLIAFEETP